MQTIFTWSTFAESKTEHGTTLAMLYQILLYSITASAEYKLFTHTKYNYTVSGKPARLVAYCGWLMQACSQPVHVFLANSQTSPASSQYVSIFQDEK